MNHEFLNGLLNTVSVSGLEEANQTNIISYAETFANQIMTDETGNVISVVNPDADCRVLLCGHIDEIGFRVTNIRDDGFIQVQKAGGVRAGLYVGAAMQIMHETEEDGKTIRQKVNAVGVVTDDLLKNSEVKDKDLLLEIGAESKEEAMKYVSVGDAVCADTEVRKLLGGNISCRALDDKAGAYVVVEAAKRAKEKGAVCGIYANTAVGEETTCRGSYHAGVRVKPDCAVIVDVTWASDCPGTDPGETGKIGLGKGPVLCLSGIVNKKMNRLLAQTAKETGIAVQYEVAGGSTYTDGDTILMSGSGVPVALVSIPERYMHSSAEVVNEKDLDDCVELISEFLMRINKDFDYKPF